MSDNSVEWDPRIPSPSPDEVLEGLRRVAPALLFTAYGAAGLLSRHHPSTEYRVLYVRVFCVCEGKPLDGNASGVPTVNFNPKDADFGGFLLPTLLEAVQKMLILLGGREPSPQVQAAITYLSSALHARIKARQDE